MEPVPVMPCSAVKAFVRESTRARIFPLMAKKGSSPVTSAAVPFMSMRAPTTSRRTRFRSRSSFRSSSVFASTSSDTWPRRPKPS